jgi:hypothetical protein
VLDLALLQVELLRIVVRGAEPAHPIGEGDEGGSLVPPWVGRVVSVAASSHVSATAEPAITASLAEGLVTR